MTISTAITKGVRVSVETFYHPKHSRPYHFDFVFAYRINIENCSPYPIQLLRRKWHIVDARGEKRVVEGEGVIGQQPILYPTESHQYVSGTCFKTELGKMYGTYTMQRLDNNSLFDVNIPIFQMVVPYLMN